MKLLIMLRFLKNKKLFSHTVLITRAFENEFMTSENYHK